MVIIIKKLKPKNNRGISYIIKCLDCGKERKIWHSQLKTGRGNYCSQKCAGKHKIKGWKHKKESKEIMKQKMLERKNRQGGIINLPDTRKKQSKTWFNRGHVPFNKGLKSGNAYLSEEKIWPAHEWIKKQKGSARNYNCEICGEKQARHWSNKNHKYKKIINDWQPLCVKCHSIFDRENNNKFNYKEYA